MSKTTKTETHIDEAALKSALTALFTKDGWEIPDDAIVGAYKHKIDQLQARVDHLTHELLLLQGEQGKAPGGRADAVELAKAGGEKPKPKPKK